MVDLVTGLGGPEGFGELVLDRNDDESSNELDLPFSPNFFGTTYDTFYVNNNGNITFNDSIGTFTPEPFPIANQPLIAAYWADVDTINEDSGLVYLAAPNEDTVVVTYDAVGYFSSKADLLNSFQIILRDKSEETGSPGDFDIEFRYETLEWTTGDASGGMDGLGGTPAQAGFDAGNEQDFLTLPGSRTAEVLELQNTSNVSLDTPGLWSFAIRQGDIPGLRPDNPLIPIIVDEGFVFDFNIQDPEDRRWIDPELAIGYDYIVNSGPNISSVTIDTDATGDDGVYDIFLPDSEGELVDSNFDVGVNETFSFIDNGFADGVNTFGIRGIDEGAQLDASDPLAFVTGLNFTTAGIVNINQNPIIPIIASSDFTEDDEGWTITENSNEVAPTYFDSGGNPGGFINATGSVTENFWVYNAPDKFLGDVSDALGGTLSYDLRQDTSRPAVDAPDVVLSGGGLQLTAAAQQTPTDSDWTSYSIDLDTSGGWVVGPFGSASESATREQLNTVLSDLTQIGIAGDFITDSNNGDLDNVVLTEGFIEDDILDDPLIRFRNKNISSGTYLFAGAEEAESIRNNFLDVFEEEGFAFNVSLDENDGLVKFNRFQNNNINGTYIFANEEESKSIRENFADVFTEEGTAFYAYGADADQGQDVVRFRNINNNTYLFALGAEAQSVRQNFTDVFVEEGVAFEVAF